MDSPLTNPYSIDILAPDQAQADALAAQAATRCRWSTRRMTLSSFVPTDQPAKLAIIADAASILNVTLAPRAAGGAGHRRPICGWPRRRALAGMRARRGEAAAGLARWPASPTRCAGWWPRRTPRCWPPNAALTRFLPLALDRLRTALDAQPVTLADIPPDLARDWRLPDGRVRVQVTGRSRRRAIARGLHAFVAEVRTRRARTRAARR